MESEHFPPGLYAEAGEERSTCRLRAALHNGTRARMSNCEGRSPNARNRWSGQGKEIANAQGLYILTRRRVYEWLCYASFEYV